MENTNEVDQDFDSLLSLLDMSESSIPETPEERFIAEYTFGPNPRIFNLYHHLRLRMSEYDHLIESGVNLSKNTFRNGITGPQSLTRLDYAKLMTETYLQSTNFAKFNYTGLAAYPKNKIADIHRTIEKLMVITETMDVIHKNKFPQEKTLSGK